MFTATQFRAHIAAQFVCTHNFKREFTPNEMAEVMARADQLIAAAGAGVPMQVLSVQQLEETVEYQKSKVATLAKESGPVGISNQGAAAAANDPWGTVRPIEASNNVATQPQPPILDGAHTTKPTAAATQVLETPDAKAASADLLSGLETALEVKCKACGDTGKSSKGKSCICQQNKVQEEMPKVETVAPPAPKLLTQKYETDQYLCEGCSNSNLTVTLIPEKTPQTAAYSCKDCSTVGEIAFDTPEELTEFISLSKKVAQEVSIVEPEKKTRKKKDDKPGPHATVSAPSSDNPVPTIPAIPQFNFPKAPPIPPAAAPVIAAAQLAEQNITGSIEVNIDELPAVDVDAAKLALAGTFDSMEPAKIIKEWESLTSKVFDAKTQTIDMLKADLTDQLLGVYTGK